MNRIGDDRARHLRREKGNKIAGHLNIVSDNQQEIILIIINHNDENYTGSYQCIDKSLNEGQCI